MRYSESVYNRTQTRAIVSNARRVAAVTAPAFGPVEYGLTFFSVAAVAFIVAGWLI